MEQKGRITQVCLTDIPSYDLAARMTPLVTAVNGYRQPLSISMQRPWQVGMAWIPSIYLWCFLISLNLQRRIWVSSAEEGAKRLFFHSVGSEMFIGLRGKPITSSVRSSGI